MKLEPQEHLSLDKLDCMNYSIFVHIFFPQQQMMVLIIIHIFIGFLVFPYHCGKEQKNTKKTASNFYFS